MIQLLFIGLLTLGISLIIECFIQPLSPSLKRNTSSYLLHFSLISLFYLIIALIAHRAIFASLFVLVTLSIFVVVSNAKFKALKEPLVFSDIVMFSQAFKYPRLYFPFLGWLPIIAGPLIIITTIALVIRFEPPLPLNYLLIIICIALLLVVTRLLALQQKPTLDIAKDIQQLGFISSLISYQLLSRQSQHKQTIANTLKSSAWTRLAEKAAVKRDIVVVQSESFFDARRLHDSVATDVLENFDTCCTQSQYYGQLEVDAWGANTMRTEFSFLSGLGFEQLGYYRYYPYHYFINYDVITLASYLQKQGYYCVCIHPHHAEFFGRSAIFPRLGFDEFIDIDSFDPADTYGPYISDAAVSATILEKLNNKQDEPCFIFAITMENHGPLHLEQGTDDDERNFYTNKLPKAKNDLTVYLRHLKNADKMIAQLTSAFNQRNKDTLFCLYGDHVPSMPGIYAETGFSDNRTDYFIWTSYDASKKEQQSQSIKVHELADKILKTL